MHAEAAAASDTLPAGHFVQVDDPFVLLKNPGRQSTHSDARPPLDLPGGHSEHSRDAARLNDPALHSLHAEEPVALVAVPASHTGHSESRFAPGEALPGAQNAHAFALLVSLWLPASQTCCGCQSAEVQVVGNVSCMAVVPK